MNKARTTAVYAAGHFLIDFACACLMLRYAAGSPGWYAAALLYNLLAFAGQMPLGLFVDRFGFGSRFAAVGCILTAAAFLMGTHPLLMSVSAGLGNALYHVGGGRDTLAMSGGKAAPLGVFVCPGAFGLFLGAMLGRSAAPLWPIPLLLAVMTAALPALCGRIRGGAVSVRPDRAGALVLAALFFVVCLRSYAGFLFSFPWKTGLWAWALMLCVVLGKGAGGILRDRIGGARASVVSLGAAALAFLLSGRPAAGCAAVFLFNMTMPVTLRAAADLLPEAEGFSFGLMTFALFLGFLPEYLGAPKISAGWMYAALSLVSLAALYFAVRRAEAS